MAEDFLGTEETSEPIQPTRARIKHLLIGSPEVVKRTIHILHNRGYAEVREWSKPVIAGGLGEQDGDVLAILIRYVLRDD